MRKQFQIDYYGMLRSIYVDDYINEQAYLPLFIIFLYQKAFYWVIYHELKVNVDNS